MPLGEFDVIARYFSRSSPRGDVLLGVGDDAALLTPAPGQVLVAATDTLVEGRHFLAGTPASAIGHQALESWVISPELFTKGFLGQQFPELTAIGTTGAPVRTASLAPPDL